MKSTDGWTSSINRPQPLKFNENGKVSISRSQLVAIQHFNGNYNFQSKRRAKKETQKNRKTFEENEKFLSWN